MSADNSADEIRRRMAELRRELSYDVHEVSRGAGILTDWRFYVRRFPWAVAGVAAAAGFMLIPQRKHVEVISPDPDALAEMFRKEQLKVQAPSPAQARESQGMMKSLLLMGLTWAAKTGMNYMGERVRTAATNRAHQAPSPGAGRTGSPRPQSSPK